jgi:hypothetical protein
MFCDAKLLNICIYPNLQNINKIGTQILCVLVVIYTNPNDRFYWSWIIAIFK